MIRDAHPKTRAGLRAPVLACLLALAAAPTPARTAGTAELLASALGPDAPVQAWQALSALPAAELRAVFPDIMKAHDGKALPRLEALLYRRAGDLSAELTRHLDDADQGLRVLAFRALAAGASDDPTVVDALFRQFDREQATVARTLDRLALMRGSDRMPADAVVRQLSPDSVDRSSIACVILSFQRSGGPYGREIVRSAAMPIRSARGIPEAYHALREAGPAVAGAVIEALDGSDAPRRLSAATFCARYAWWWDEVPSALLDALSRRLGDADPAVRDAAAMALAMVDKAADPALASALASDAPARRLAACRSLGLRTRKQGGARKLLASALLKDPDAAVREAAAAGIEALGGKEAEAARESLAAALADAAPAVRASAARALGASRKASRKAADDLLKACGDADAGVRLAAAGALGRGLKDGLGAALGGALDGDPAAMFEAWGQAETAPAPVLTLAASSLGSADPALRGGAAYCLARCDPSRLFKAGTPLPGTASAAADLQVWLYGAARSDPSPALAAWTLGLASHGDPGVRRAAVRILGTLPSGAAPGAGPRLGALLSDPDACVAAEAAWALGRLDKEAISAGEALTAALGDRRSCGETWPVAAAASLALASMGPQALPLLLKAAAEGPAPQRSAAMDLLGRLGARALEARPLLVQGLGDPDPAVVQSAARALAGFPSTGALWEPLQACLDKDRDSASLCEGALRALHPPAAVLRTLMAGSLNAKKAAILLAQQDAALAGALAPELVALVRDNDGLRFDVLAALEGIDADAMESLIPLAADPKGAVAETALAALAPSRSAYAKAWDALAAAGRWDLLDSLVLASPANTAAETERLYRAATAMRPEHLAMMGRALAQAGMDAGFVLQALSSGRPGSRRAALALAAALEPDAQDSERLLPELRRALTDESGGIRAGAAQALGQMGARAAAARGDLKSLAARGSGDKAAAESALQRIGD